MIGPALRVEDDGRWIHGWDVLLVCLSGFILTAVGRVHQLFPVLLPFKPALVTGALAILFLLVDRSPARRLAGFGTPANRYLLALVAWMALSVPGALWRSGAFATLIDFMKTAVMFFVIIAAVRSVRDVERLALVYFGAVVLFALVALSRFELGAEGRLADLYYYDANDFATLAVTALPVGLYFAFARQRWGLRLAAWIGIGVLSVGFIWSGSRGGFLAFLAVIVYILVRFSSIAKRWRIGALAAIAVLAIGTASTSYWTRMGTLLEPATDYNLTDEQGRLELWKRGIGYMTEYPILGVGAGNFPAAEGTISPLARRQERGIGVKWGPPHNSYVQVGAELGIVGLLIFAAFLAKVFQGLGTLRGPSGPVPEPLAATRLAQSLTAALLGFIVGAFFLTLAYHEMLYILAALAIALRKTRMSEAFLAGHLPVVHRSRRSLGLQLR